MRLAAGAELPDDLVGLASTRAPTASIFFIWHLEPSRRRYCSKSPQSESSNILRLFDQVYTTFLSKLLGPKNHSERARMIRKVWTIARREYGAMVATKAFLVSITFMPLLWFGGVIFATRMQNVHDVTEKTIVIADGSGGALFDDLEKSVAARNAFLSSAAAADKPSPQVRARRQSGDTLSDADRLELSNEIGNEKIVAFVEIPAAILES